MKLTVKDRERLAKFYDELTKNHSFINDLLNQPYTNGDNEEEEIILSDIWEHLNYVVPCLVHFSPELKKKQLQDQIKDLKSRINRLNKELKTFQSEIELIEKQQENAKREKSSSSRPRK